MKLSEGMKAMLLETYESGLPGTPGPIRSALMRRGLVRDYTGNRVGYLTPEGKKVAKDLANAGPKGGEEVTIYYGAERWHGIVTAVDVQREGDRQGDPGLTQTTVTVVLWGRPGYYDGGKARKEGNSL